MESPPPADDMPVDPEAGRTTEGKSMEGDVKKAVVKVKGDRKGRSRVKAEPEKKLEMPAGSGKRQPTEDPAAPAEEVKELPPGACVKIDKVYSEAPDDEESTDDKDATTSSGSTTTSPKPEGVVKGPGHKPPLTSIPISSLAKMGALPGMGNVRFLGGPPGVRAPSLGPLLVSMGGNSSGISLLPAGLPPGRYVIVPGTSTTTSSCTTMSTVNSKASLTTTLSPGSLQPRFVTSGGPVLTTPVPTTALQPPMVTSLAAAISNAVGAASSLSALPPPRSLYTRERGRRKSYTAAEKLAMIEAVEGGQRKSAVADRFGVAPSTLACILAQKHKIRTEQSGMDNLSRRRVRQGKGGSSSASGLSAAVSAAVNAAEALRSPAAMAAAAASLLRMEAPQPQLAMMSQDAPPFTHFLASLQAAQASLLDQVPEEIVSVPDLVERMGHSLSATTSGSMGQTLGGGGGGSGVRCKSEEALGTAGSFSSGLAGGDHDDVDGQRVEDDVTVEPEFLHDPLDVKTHIPGMATITSQAMISPLLSPPSSSAAPLRLSQHHRLPPTTGSATNNSTEENNIQPESVSARITTSPPQPQGLAGPYLLKKETHCTTVLDQLLRDETFTDVTLTAEGQSIRAHRVVLCLASAYFRQVLSHDQNVHSVVILRDIKFAELKNIIHFIYTGEATVDASELESFMKTAEILEISSLCEGHKSISTAGLVSQSYGSGFNIGEFERLMGTKRNRKDAPPMPSKNRKISGEQSSRSSTPVGISATSVTVVKEEPIEHDSSKMHTDEPVYRGSGKKSKGILEDPPTFGSKSLSTTTTFETGEMEAMEEGSNSGGDGKSDTSGRSSPSATMLPDITTVPGRCPYCPHLNQEFRGVSMMRHLLVSHPCKPAFPCDNCFRVFVRKGQYRAHQAKCNDV